MASVAVVSRIIEKRKQQRAQLNSGTSNKSQNESRAKNKSFFINKNHSQHLQWDKLDLIKRLARKDSADIRRILEENNLETKKSIRNGYIIILAGILFLAVGMLCFVVHFNHHRFIKSSLFTKLVFGSGPLVTAAGVMLAICGYISIQVSKEKQRKHVRDLLKSYSE